MENLTPRHTLLDVISVELPCDVDWDALPGEGPVRVCPRCDKAVHNLSALPRAEAERLLAERGDSLCVRYDRDAMGKVLTMEYATPPRRHRRRARVWIGLGTAAALLGAAFQVMWLRARPPITTVVGACPPFRPTPAPVAGSRIAPSGSGTGVPSSGENRSHVNSNDRTAE